MPKVTKSKPRSTYEAPYDQKAVEKALDAIKKGSSLRQASNMYGVPKSTLQAKKTNKIPVVAKKGPATYLTAGEENMIIHWILYCSQRCFPVTKSQLFHSVQKLVCDLNRKTPFKNNKPGRHWYESFCKRHPHIYERICPNLSVSRPLAVEEKLKNWFQEVENYLKPLNLIDIDGSRVYNLDECAFYLVPKGDKVLVERGSKAIHKVVNGDSKESLTVLFNINANGVMLPPMILFWYEIIPASITDSLPSEWIAGTTKRGWMSADCFYIYITTIFYPWLVKQKTTFPIILYLDGHAYHVTLQLSNFCKEKEIELIALFTNATQILNPLQVAVISPLETKYKKMVNEWRIEHFDKKIRRQTFAPILKKTLDSFDNLSTKIKNGFESCGLLPLSLNRVRFNIRDEKKKVIETNAIIVEKAFNEQNQNLYKNHLNFFENSQSPDVLQDFNRALENNTSISNRENKGLFDYWMKLKTFSS